MKLMKYLIDRKFLIIFYIILMFFISSVVYLSPSLKVSIDNILYINYVSLVFFVIYILTEYINLSRYFSEIDYTINNVKEDIINSLPEPKTYEQSLYYKLMKNIYNEQNQKIYNLHKEKIENLEYTNSWVHEIKTPIAVSRLVIENSEGKSKEEILNSLEEELDKIESKVEQALYYSRVDDFSKDYLISEVNLEKIIKELVKKHAKTFINKKIKINIKDTDIEVLSDKKWLYFIIDQILCNSLKYTNELGVINISTEINEKGKIIIIEDNGIGIKKEDLSRVFEKGFTGHTGREIQSSTGIGLYLAKRLSGKLGHGITVESIYGEYTKVKINFPKIIDYFNVTKM